MVLEIFTEFTLFLKVGITLAAALFTYLFLKDSFKFPEVPTIISASVGMFVWYVSVSLITVALVLAVLYTVFLVGRNFIGGRRR